MTWNKELRKIAVLGTIVSCGFLLTSCCNQKEILQPTVRYIESHSIDTCFVFRTDTAFVWETDILRVETLIRDTVIRQRIETKPIIIRDTIRITLEKESAKPRNSETNASNKTTKSRSVFRFLASFCLAILLITWIRNKIKRK